MKTIIIGAGFAGLAAAYFAAQRGDEVEVWDPKGPGGGASGVAAGLLHKYGGVRSRATQGTEEAFEAAEQLLAAVGGGVVAGRGLLRIWRGARQERAFRLLAKRYGDVELREGGIWIPSAYVIDCKRYCEELLRASGAKLRLQRAEHLDLDADQIIVTAGWETTQLVDVPIKPVKGQLVRFAWPSDRPPLPHAMGGGGYIVMAPDGKSVLAGATFEHDFVTTEPTDDAPTMILEKVGYLVPGLDQMPILEVMSGVRCITDDRLPLAFRHSDKVSVICALGSKGLLWHALLGKRGCVIHDASNGENHEKNSPFSRVPTSRMPADDT